MKQTIVPTEHTYTGDVFRCELCVFVKYQYFLCENIKCCDNEREDDSNVYFRLE